MGNIRAVVLTQMESNDIRSHTNALTPYTLLKSSSSGKLVANNKTFYNYFIIDLDKWMSLKKLKLNKDKTELLYLYSKHNPQQSLPSIRFGQDIIQPSQFARNIGVIFDSTMSMLPHISSICKSASYHLRNISRIRKFLSTKTTEILVHAFVSSKLDHCNSLLYNVPKCALKKLQSVQNAAARLITCSRKYDHITPILKELHWLPISKRIKFKIMLLTFKARHQQSLSTFKI